MESNLNSLISKIKTEGVDQAQKQAKAIIDKAQREAETIINQAQAKQKAVIKETEAQAEKIKQAADESLRLAARDTILSLRNQITGLFDKVLKSQATSQLDNQFFKEAMVKVIENFSSHGIADIEILLNEKDKAGLQKAVLEALSREVKNGVTFKADNSLKHGFRIGEKNKNYYYDFTDEAIVELFKLYLHPQLSKFLD